MDVDLMSLGRFLVGGAVAIWAYSWVKGWAWTELIVGFLLCIPFVINFFGWGKKGTGELLHENPF